MMFLYVSQSLYWVWKYIYPVVKCVSSKYLFPIAVDFKCHKKVFMGTLRLFLETKYDDLTTAVSQAQSQVGAKASHHYICSNI